MSDTPADLDVVALRARRDEVRAREAAVSYRRRLLQAQLDILAALDGVYGDDGATSLATRLVAALADDEPSDRGSPRALVTDVAGLGSVPALPDDLDQLDADGRAALFAQLREAERELSDERRDLLVELDELQDELIRRYREHGVDAGAFVEQTP